MIVKYKLQNIAVIFQVLTKPDHIQESTEPVEHVDGK